MKQLVLAALVALLVATSVTHVSAFCLWDFVPCDQGDCWWICW